jgi:hypothetical protein
LRINDVYKDYKVTFDFKDSLIVFTKAAVTAYVPDTAATSLVIPFVFSGHIPVITCMIERRQLLMGVDCAAFPNLMSANLLSAVKGISNVSNTILRGAGTPVTVAQGNIQELRVGDIPYRDMKFTFDNNSLLQINQGRDIVIEGLLGIPFLKQYKTAIDFPNRRVEIYLHKN